MKSTFMNQKLKLSAGDIFKSHLGGGIIDIVGVEEGFKAPFDCQLVAKIGDAGHTYVFTSKYPVEVPGLAGAEYISFRCTHQNNNDEFKLYDEFNQGDVCYYMGTAGEADGSHIHLQFARGKAQSPWLSGLITNRIGGTFKRIITDWVDNTLMPWDSFYVPHDTVISNHDGSSDYKADYYWSSTTGAKKTLRGFYSADGSDFFLSTQDNPINIRERPDKLSGSLILVEKNSYLKIQGISEFVDGEGYSWGYTEYGGNFGWVQLDPNANPLIARDHIIKSEMYIFDIGANMRDCPNGSKVRAFIPVGKTVKIIEFLGYKNTDGYRWVKVTYAGFVGYIQFDTKVMSLKGDW